MSSGTRHLLYSDRDVALQLPVEVALPQAVSELQDALRIFSNAIRSELLGGTADNELSSVDRELRFKQGDENIKFVFSQDGAWLPSVQMIRFEKKLVVNSINHFSPRTLHQSFSQHVPRSDQPRPRSDEGNSVAYDNRSDHNFSEMSADREEEDPEQRLAATALPHPCMIDVAGGSSRQGNGGGDVNSCWGDNLQHVDRVVLDRPAIDDAPRRQDDHDRIERQLTDVSSRSANRRRAFERRSLPSLQQLLESSRELRLATSYHLSSPSKGVLREQQQPLVQTQGTKMPRPRVLLPPPPQDAARDATRSLSGGTALLQSQTMTSGLPRWSPSPSPDAPMPAAGGGIIVTSKVSPPGNPLRNPLVPPAVESWDFVTTTTCSGPSNAERNFVSLPTRSASGGTQPVLSVTSSEKAKPSLLPKGAVAAPAASSSDLFRIPFCAAVSVLRPPPANPPSDDPSATEQLVKDVIPLPFESKLWFRDEILEKVAFSPTSGNSGSADQGRRILVHGPPRSGKTTCVHLIASEMAATHLDKTNTFVVVYNWSKLLLNEPTARSDMAILHCEIVGSLVDCIAAHQGAAVGRIRHILLGLFKKIATQRMFSSCVTPALLDSLGPEIPRVWDNVLRPLHRELHAILAARTTATNPVPMQHALRYFQLLLVDLPMTIAGSLGCSKVCYVFDDADALLTIAPTSAGEGESSALMQSERPVVSEVTVDGKTTVGMEVFKLWMSHLLRSPSSKIHFIGSLGSANLARSQPQLFSQSHHHHRRDPSSPLEDENASNSSGSDVTRVVVGGVSLSISLRSTFLFGLLNLVPIGVLVEKYKLPSRICCTSRPKWSEDSNITQTNDNHHNHSAGAKGFFDIGLFVGCPAFLSYLCNFVEELRASSWNPQLSDSSFTQTTLTIDDHRVFALFEDMANTLSASSH